MSSTEVDRTRALAGALFDEVIVPLAARRKAAGQQAYFPLAGEPGAKTYYEQPLLGKMQPADFEFPGGGTPEGLLEALARYWQGQGETDLAAMVPRLKEIATAVADAAHADDGSVSILCYTMF
ncbi:MAG: hypothetical protein K1X74_01705 [Pirellulales bacterium]|nr:hypothetical protein [Pirellulales bacterium]